MINSIHAQLNDSQWLTDQIVKEHKNCAQIARELGIANRSAVNRAVKKLGLSDKIYRTKFPQLSDKAWLKKQLETKTIVEIATMVGATPGNVGDRVMRYGLSLTVNGDKSEAVKAGLKKRWPKGRVGAETSNWRGGRRNFNGYVTIYSPDHPNKKYPNRAGYVFEHRLVAEKKLDRPLRDDEVVHHLNGIKNDNRPENLEIVSRKDHVHKHYVDSEGIQAKDDRIKQLEKLLKDNNIKY